MIEKLKGLYYSYQEIINYLIIGVITTIISLVVKYALLFTVLDAKNAIQLQLSIIISWLVAVVFAYITNRIVVFKSKSSKILKEMLLFFSSRIVTLLMESVILWFFITYLKLNTNIYVIVWTLVAQVIVIVGNYILSKFIVFSNKKVSISNKKKWFSIFFFLLVLVLCYLFPYTHDDWDWGSATGLERLENGFSNFNGRWLGNSLGMLFTRVRFLRAFCIAFTLLEIVVCMKNIVNKENKQLGIFIVLSFLLMPIRMFVQSFAWTVGFANYVPPMLLLLFVIYWNKDFFQEKFVNKSNWWIVPFFLIGFAGTLFMEHITIYFVLLGIILVIYGIVKFRKIVYPNIAYFIGTIGGSILMFSNSGYQNLFGIGDGYRSIENENIFRRAIDTYFNSLKDYLVHNNFALNLIISVLLLVLAYQFYKKFKKELTPLRNRVLKLASTVVITYIIYIVYLHMIGNINLFVRQDIRNYIEGSFILLYLLSLITIVVIVVKKKDKKFRILFEFASIFLFALPLLIVTPIGPRCFFAPYLFFVLIAIELLDIAFEKPKVEVLFFLRTTCVFLMILLISVYGYAFYVEQKRVSYIEEHKKNNHLVLPKIPYEKYMQHPNPESEWFKEQFRKYYGIEKDVKLEFIEFVEWSKEYEK